MAAARPSGPNVLRERSFHRWLARTLPAGRSGALPLGDDAAALTPPRGRVAVLTTDALVEGVHFLPSAPGALIGRAAAGVSLSDAAAKGALPAGLLLAVLVPVGSPEQWARDVVRGADRAGREFGAPVVGGDTKPSPVRSVVSTVVAWGDPRHLAPRSGAREGDVVVTTGYVGRGGWTAREYHRSPGASSLRRWLEVRPRVHEGPALAANAHAMIDTSDGIADASRLVADASGVAVTIEEAKLPFVKGLRDLPPATRLKTALYGGDYELLATLAPRGLSPAERAVRRGGGRLTVIGRVERGRGAWLVRDGARGRTRREPMPSGGWRPFGSPRRETAEGR